MHEATETGKEEKMSDIQKLLNQILEARYGKDVRQSIHDSINLCYDEATGEIQRELIQSITENATKAEHSANQAAESAEIAVGKADKAIESADLATQEADNAAISARTAVEAAEEAIEAISQATGDSTITFNSDDVGPDGNPMLLDVEKLTSGEKLKELLNKGSRIVTNVRYLIKLLGSNDISSLGNGTVTGAITAMNEALSGKQDEIKLTGSRALVSDSSGKIAVSAVTATELGHLDGVTANIQSQIDNLNNIKITQTSGWIDPGAVKFNTGNYSGSWQSGGVQYSWIQVDGGTLQMQISIANVSHALLIRTKIKSQTWSSIPWRTI